MSNPLFAIKSVQQLRAEAEGHHGLKRTLGPFDLIALGIGAIIGAGLFVRTAAAAANNAGPSVTIGFIVAAVMRALERRRPDLQIGRIIFLAFGVRLLVALAV